MKTLIRSFVAFALVITFSADAQVNRSNTKKSVAYRANYQKISTGNSSSHNLEIRMGTLWAWGKNNFGQLGDGTDTNRIKPKQIGTDTKWISVATGTNHCLGLKADGTLWAWGDNQYGQLGDGTDTSRSIPMKIGNDIKWICITAGSDQSFGLKADGTLWAWGKNDFGQLGDGSLVNKKNPLQIGAGINWISISAGSNHAMGVKTDGTLWAWGNNNYGQLGDSTIINRSSPVKIGTDNKWVGIAAGGSHSIGLKSDGTLWAWGNNISGELGDGTNVNQIAPIRIGSSSNWVAMDGGGDHSLGLKSDGTLWSWGANNFGQLGDGSAMNINYPKQVGNSKNWVGIEAGNIHSLGYKADGTQWAWGNNAEGQIGDSTNVNRINPTEIGNVIYWISISAGGQFSLGLKSNGTIWGWGHDNSWQLGDSSHINRPLAMQIGIDSNWVSIIGGIEHTLCLASDGTLWSCGWNTYGQLGNGNNSNGYKLTQAGTASDWVSIAGGANHSLGLKADGTLWAWGRNNNGQLGINSTTNQNTPTQVGTDKTWTSIAAGNAHSLALKSDGTLWGWGSNDDGQAGGGISTFYRVVPIQIGTDNIWVSISANGNHSLALKSDGTAWSWGNNQSGQLGGATSVGVRTTPGQIGADIKWVSLAAGGHHSMGLKSDGTLWTWGMGQYGELGVGINLDNNAPVQSLSSSICLSMAAGTYHSLSIKPERKQFCATGLNFFGPLGDGTKTNRNIFVCNTNCIRPPAPGASNKIICSGSATLLTAYGSGSIGWYSASTGGIYLGGGANFLTPILNADTTFYVQDSTCIESANRTGVSIKVNAMPAASVGTTKIICEGDSISLGSAEVNGNTYSWTSSPTGFTSTLAKTVVSPSVTTVFYLTETIIVTGCSRSDSIKILVNPRPLALAGFNHTICAGGNTIIGAVPVNGNTYSWTSSPPGFTSTSSNPVITPTTTTVYYLNEKTTSTGCSKTDSVKIIVSTNPAPVANTGPDTTICYNASITIGSPPVSGNTYSWTSVPASFTSTISNPSLSPFTTTVYYLTETVTTTGCTKSNGVTVTVKPKLNLNIILNGFTMIATQNGASYQWLNCAGFALVTGATNQTFTPTVTGDYAVIITLNGCSDTSSCLTVNKTGIDNWAAKNIPEIYPNPNTGSFTVKSASKAAYSLVNELGQTIGVYELNGRNNFVTNIENLQEGVYFIIGFNEGQWMGRKVIVIK